MIACVCTWHTQHDAAHAEVERRLSGGETMATAVHAITEAYAVLTRLPPPHRMAPVDALALMEGNFLDGAVSLDMRGYRALLRQAAAQGVAGGRFYDALIAECAVKAKASVLLTFNARHFGSFGFLEAAGVRVVVPGMQ